MFSPPGTSSSAIFGDHPQTLWIRFFEIQVRDFEIQMFESRVHLLEITARVCKLTSPPRRSVDLDEGKRSALEFLSDESRRGEAIRVGISLTART